MRIAWLSNAPWSATGYGTQTKLFAPRLQTLLGHSVAVLAFYGLEGAMLQLPDGQGGTIPVYPKGFHPYGQDVVGAHSAHYQADLTISLMDAWVCEPRLYGARTRWAPWFPVDMEPLPELIRAKVAQGFQPIAMSKWGQQIAQAAGIDARYVPHGVDTSVFCPGEQRAAREKVGLPLDRWIVGMVAANKGAPSRKCFPQQLEAFAQFHAQHPDTLLYLHTSKSENGESGGVNLPELCEHLGIADAVLYADQYQSLLGFPEPAMVEIYRSLDVLMNVSMGEGFGIPILEAQACGVAVIVGDWTSMSELCFGGFLVGKEEADRFWTPLAAYQWLPRVGAIAEALGSAYRERTASWNAYAAGRALAYDADTVTQTYWKPVLDEISERLAAPDQQGVLCAPGVV